MASKSSAWEDLHGRDPESQRETRVYPRRSRVEPRIEAIHTRILGMLDVANAQRETPVSREKNFFKNIKNIVEHLERIGDLKQGKRQKVQIDTMHGLGISDTEEHMHYMNWYHRLTEMQKIAFVESLGLYQKAHEMGEKLAPLMKERWKKIDSFRLKSGIQKFSDYSYFVKLGLYQRHEIRFAKRDKKLAKS